MNTIKQTFCEMKKNTASLKIPVRIGSNLMFVGINRETKSIDLIKTVLQHIARSKSKSTEIDMTKLKSYVLFERARGIDRLLNSEQNIFELWLEWNLNNQDKIEFVVKLYKPIKKTSKTIVRNKNLYEKGRQIANKPPSRPPKMNVDLNNKTIHLYEQINETDVTKMDHIYENVADLNKRLSIESSKDMDCWKSSKLYLKKIIKNEKKLALQAKKLIKLDSSIVKHVKNVKKMIDELNYNNQINFNEEFIIDIDEKFSILSNVVIGLDSSV